MYSDKRRCKAQTKAGRPCGAAPTPGGLCFFHSNPAKASELGRIGGRKNHRSGVEETSVAQSLYADSPFERLTNLYKSVSSGRVLPARATVLLNITKTQLELQEKMKISLLEQALEQLKQVIAIRDLESETNKDPFDEDDEE
jgi:hypothetical protein